MGGVGVSEGRWVGYMYVQGLRVCDERLLGFMLINDLVVWNGTILVYIASFWYRLHQCTKYIYKQEFRSGWRPKSNYLPLK